MFSGGRVAFTARTKEWDRRFGSLRGEHVDCGEERGSSKAISHLFAGEPNTKWHRIGLDEVAWRPTKHAVETERNPKLAPLQRSLLFQK